MKNFLTGLLCVILVLGLMVAAYFIGDLILSYAKSNGAVILTRDIVGARIGAPVLGGVVGLLIFAVIVDKFDS